MGIQRAPSRDESEDDFETSFSVFMLVFWPVALVLGLIDYFLVLAYDLWVPVLIAAIAAGLIGVHVHRARQQRRDLAS